VAQHFLLSARARTLSLGTVLRMTDAQAEATFKRALAIKERALGANHADVAGGLTNLAALYHSQGKEAAAAAIFERVLTIRERAFGSDHPDVAQTLNSLAITREAAKLRKRFQLLKDRLREMARQEGLTEKS